MIFKLGIASIGTVLLAIQLNAQQQQINQQEDRRLAETLLKNAASKATLNDFVSSAQADTALLYPKLRLLAANFTELKIHPDSIKLVNTQRLPIDGADKQIVVVYLNYKNIEWDEMLLLTSTKDYQLLDVAQPQDVFTFNPNLRARYYNNQATLVGYFGIPSKEGAMQAVKTIIRLVNAKRTDSLYQYVAYADQNNPKRKYLAEPLNPEVETDRVRLFAIYNKLRGLFASPESIYTEGKFYTNPNFGSCSVYVVCKETKNTQNFSFVLRNGRYLLNL